MRSLFVRPDFISIHSLRKEGDTRSFAAAPTLTAFQSTPSARRETMMSRWAMENDMISIHSLRKEGDMTHSDFKSVMADFNPLPPQGGRLQNCTMIN